MYADIPNIISDILKNGAQLAIVSRNASKAMSVINGVRIDHCTTHIFPGVTEHFTISM
jgi:hypothetical protein